VTSGSVGDTYHGDDGVTTNSIFSPYNNADGTYRENPLESLGGVNGTWLYIRLPKKISLDHVNLISRSGHPQRVPRSATFLGSNNGTDWTSIFSFSDAGLIGDSSSGEHTYTYNVNSTVKYEYFGFVWEKIGTDYYVNLEELELYGHEEDNLADPKCSGYDGHEQAKLNAFCIGENVADPKCEGQPGYLDAANWTWEEIKEWLISEGFDDFMLLDMVKRSLEDPLVNLQNLNSNTLYMWDDMPKREILDARDRLFASVESEV